MMPLFADTFFFLALVNPKDAAHQRALEYSEASDFPIVTTCWVLTEFADAMSRVQHRPLVASVLADLQADPNHTIVPASDWLFAEGVELFNSRPDKDWSLTDCISFIVMEDRQMADALTGDRHFVQAGFNALLLPQ